MTEFDAAFAALPPDPTGGLTIEALEHADEYLLELPVHVALTVAMPGGAARGLPLADAFHLHGCIGLVLVDGEGREVARHVPRPVVDAGAPEVPVFELRPGERRRMLVDLRPLLPPLAPGTYELRVAYAATDALTWSNPVVVRFRRLPG